MEGRKIELQNWMLMRDAGPELLEEVEERIASVKKELRKTHNQKRKDELRGVLNSYRYVKQQITENMAISEGQIQNLQEDIRKEIKEEQIENFKKS